MWFVAAPLIGSHLETSMDDPRDNPYERLRELAVEESERSMRHHDVLTVVEHALAATQVKRHGPRTPFRLGLVVSASVAALILVMGGLVTTDEVVTFKVGGRSGEVSAWIETASGGEQALRFSEGTTVLIREESRTRVRSLSEWGAVIEIERGSVAVAVRHRAMAH
jgi:hypothetical protein